MNRSSSSISLTFIIIFTILSSLGSCIIGFHSTQPTYAGESDRPVILFDQTRNPTKYPRQTNTHLTIKEGFSDLVGLLKNAGFNVQTLDEGPVTQQSLKGVAVLVLPSSINQLQSSEESTIVNYVENGGGLLILGENGDKGYSGLAEKFGVTMLPGLLCDGDYGLKGRPFSIKISNMRRHDVTLGVESFIFNWGQPLLADNSAQPLAFTSSQSWYETDGDGKWEGEPYGSFAVVAATERGAGRVISLGSSVCLANLNPSYWEGGLKDFNTLRLIFNIFNWLGKQRLFGIDLNYTMIVDETLAKDHMVHVKAEASKLNTPKLTMTMSMWHAGGYQNRKATGFLATTESGSPIKVAYSATGQEQFWTVECGAVSKILFEYSVMMDVLLANMYQGYLGTNYGMTEAAATFLIPLNCPIANIKIGFSLPSGWSAFSPWQREGNKFTIPSFGGTMFRLSPTIELQLFLWSTYAVGTFNQFSKMIDNTNVTIVTYSGWEKSFQQEIVKTSFDLYEYTVRLFAKLAQERYIAIWAPLADDGRDVSFCEWSTSQGLTTNQKKYFAIQDSVSQNPLQFHHRIFHIWNAFEPTGLAWATSDEIWFCEGGCAYYNSKAMARVGKLRYIPSLPFKLKWYREKIVGTRYDLSLVEAAKLFQAGFTEYKVDNFVVMQYHKGALVSYLLDCLIQRMPGNRSLDDFMRYLYASYGDHTGTISNKNLQLHLNAITGFNFSLFFDKYIYGTEQLPLLLEKEQIAVDWARFSQTLYLATTPVMTITSTPNSFVTGETVTITVGLQDVDGNALTNQDVIFGFDSSQIGRARTDSKGIASITYKFDLGAGWHDIWAILRSQIYRETRATTAVVVRPLQTKTETQPPPTRPSETSLQLPLFLGLALCAVAAAIALPLMRSRGKKQALISQTKTTAFPITQVLRFSLEDMKARGTRSRITALSIMLSVAFMVFLSTMASILTVMVGQTTTVQTHYYLMEIIALMVCLVGVTNTMLMSVTERFKEIGVMKCLGARDKHVVIVFLFEALILGILGGIGGALAGLGIGMIAFGLQVGWELIALVPLHEYVRHAAVGVVTAVLLSEVGSLYPAYYVARLKPMGALRHEL